MDFLSGLDRGGTYMLPEGLVNLNAMLIMLVCFVVAGWSARMKATNSMALGTFLASAALLIFANFNWAWLIVIGIAIFSVGEMLSAPKSSEYIGNIAAPDKKAMYLGFSQLPLGIGWTLESYIGPTLYGEFASKEQISRAALADQGLTVDDIAAIPIGEAFVALTELRDMPAHLLTAELYANNNIGVLWYLMASVGLATAVGLFYYGRWTYRYAASSR